MNDTTTALIGVAEYHEGQEKRLLGEAAGLDRAVTGYLASAATHQQSAIQYACLQYATDDAALLEWLQTHLDECRSAADTYLDWADRDRAKAHKKREHATRHAATAQEARRLAELVTTDKLAEVV